MAETAPGPWLRLTAVAASAATLLAVVSGAAGLDTAHRLLAALAVPPLVALVVSAWFSQRPLLPPALAALVCFGAAALATQEGVHVAAAALAFSAVAGLTAQTFRTERAPRVPWRDYLTPT